MTVKDLRTRAPVRQIAEAVEAQGGDLDDVRDLVQTWERMHARLRDANSAFNAGDVKKADEIGAELESEFGKPLKQIAADRQARKTGGDR